MAKKKLSRRQRRNKPQPSPVERLQTALKERRFQQALELAKGLHKEQSTDTHLNYLIDAAIGRVGQLIPSGKFQDALTILESILTKDSLTDDHREQLAEYLARCGKLELARTQFKEDGIDPGIEKRLLCLTADAAVQQEKKGRGLLPEQWQADFDTILQAFDQLENKDDEGVIESLKAIGLRSPFIEWKLCLRGLLAYYQQDDERALENWQRLQDDRYPSRLIAPLRFSIDQSFREAQSRQTQEFLKQAFDSTIARDSIQHQLKEVPRILAGRGGLARALNHIERHVLPLMRKEAPAVVPRLANCMYWALLDQENESLVRDYARVFTPPTEDPSFNRLNALGYEKGGDLQEAHKYWQRYEDEIAKSDEMFPANQKEFARSLIWHRMGVNAANVPDIETDIDMSPIFGGRIRRPISLKPNAEKCLKKCLELNPKHLHAYEDLLTYYENQGDNTKALSIAKEYVKHASDNLEALQQYAQLLSIHHKYAEALKIYQDALKLNPLDRQLRSKVSSAHLYLARQQAEDEQFDDARQSFQSALEMGERNHASIYCKWAACEIKAGDETKGDELLEKAMEEQSSRLAIIYSMLIEIIRLKLPHRYKKQFNDDFNAGLKEDPTVPAVSALLSVTASHESAGVTYHGQKTHRTKVLKYASKALTLPSGSFTEDQLEICILSLNILREYQRTLDFGDRGRRLYPNNPIFPLSMAEAEIQRGSSKMNSWAAERHLERALNLAMSLSTEDPRKELILNRIEQFQQTLAALNPWARMFGSSFGGGFPFEDVFFDDDEEYFEA